MMDQKKEVKVGDKVSTWNLCLREYEGCEFRPITGTSQVEITKVPDPKPEIPDEPMTRGTVVTIEGDDEFIALRFTDADNIPYPFDEFIAIRFTDADNSPYHFVEACSYTSESDHSSWGEIVSRAEGRKIIVHKMVDPNEAPSVVATYAEWVAIPEDERKKYKWLDSEGDLWWVNEDSGVFEVDGWLDGGFTLDEKFFPLIRDEKIG